MRDVNSVILIGRLTADPEMKITSDNIYVTHFNLAVNRGIDKKNNELVDFFPISLFGRLAEVANKYCFEGSRIAIVGKLYIRSYQTKDGAKINKTELSVSEIQLLDNKKNQESVDKNVENEEIETDFDYNDLPF